MTTVGEATHFVTFRQASGNRNRYFLIAAPEEATELEVNDHVRGLVGEDWSMVYPIDQLAEQVSHYGLEETKNP